MIHHAFTVEEANEMLPDVRVTLQEIRELRDAGRISMDKLAILDALWGDLVSQPENPDHEEYAEHRRFLSEVDRTIEELIQERLTGRGIRFPSGGVDHGLVDFPTTLDGRWVYLCWRSDEAEVAHWHELDGGYSGRRLITVVQRQRMGLQDDPARQDDSALDF